LQLGGDIILEHLHWAEHPLSMPNRNVLIGAK